jgi:hypothetical protein
MKPARWNRAQYAAYCQKLGVVWKKPTPVRKGKTRTEAEFEEWFAFQHPSLTILYEALKVRIDETCWYLPDFFVPEILTFYEVKGPHIFEDSIIKFKAARALHRWAKFTAWQKKNGVWREIRKLPETVHE